jgi:APA family basic amino acid/polyamine antiporter
MAEEITTKKPEVLQRRVGLFQAVAMITGLVVGASIFILVPTLAGMTGPSVWLAYAFAAIPALFVVLYEIQLTGTLPVTGANYVCGTRVLSPAWGSALAFAAVLSLISSNVLVSIGFGQYVIGFIQSFYPAFTMDPLILPIACILLFSLLNFLNVEIASVVQAILFLAFVIGMIIFGIVGSAHYNPVNMTPMFTGGAMMFIVAIVLASFSWSGLVALADIGGEIKNPRRNLPLALIIAFLVVLVLYVLQPFALIGSMGAAEAAKAGSPAIMVEAGKLMPGWGVWIIFLAAMGAILTTVNANIWSAGRELVAWARDGLFPKSLAHLHPKFKTPDVATLIVAILHIIAISIAATLDKYALATVLSLMVIQIIGAYCVLRIPKKLPELYKKSLFKFNTFWRWFIFIGTCVTSGFIFLMGIVLDMMDDKGNPTKTPWVVAIFVAAVAIGFIWYYLRKAYLKRKGIDLEGNLKKIADATLAEAEEHLSVT